MRLVAVVVLTLALVACVGAVDKIMLDETPRPPTTNIDVFTSLDDIERPYKQIAMLAASEGMSSSSESKLVKLLKKNAKQIGADGIVIVSFEESSEGGILLSYGIWAESKEKRVRAIAIVYTD